jgi:hypothetical protein
MGAGHLEIGFGLRGTIEVVRRHSHRWRMALWPLSLTTNNPGNRTPQLPASARRGQ